MLSFAEAAEHDQDDAARLSDGRLWCGHAVPDVIVDENGCHVCRKCTRTLLSIAPAPNSRAYESCQTR